MKNQRQKQDQVMIDNKKEMAVMGTRHEENPGEPPLEMLEIKATCTFNDRLSFECNICRNGLK